jgi:hypothetical protein
MERPRSSRSHETTGSQETVAQLAVSSLVEPISIDLDELEQARADKHVSALLEAAETEGIRVEREGRQRW